MFRSIIKAIDSLFVTGEAQVVTTKTEKFTEPFQLISIIHHCATNNISIQGDPAIVRAMMDRCGVMIVEASEEEFVFEGRHIPIPASVRNLIPFSKIDIANHQYFPIDQSMDIFVQAEANGQSIAANWGGKVDDSSVAYIAPPLISELIVGIKSEIEQTPDVVANARCGDLVISSTIRPALNFISVETGSGATISVALPNVELAMAHHPDDEVEALIACIHARAILLALATVGEPTADYNEHDLRSAILALLLVDRTAAIDESEDEQEAVAA